MREETIRSDIAVIGGGLAGVTAAIAAARLGRSVSLVQNRPMLGGNSSSEIRVWVCGATGHGANRYARETGIMGELFLENQYRNPEGNPYLWDSVLLDAVLAEPNLRLFLNTDVHEVEAGEEEGGRQIRSVTGWMMGSERRIRFVSERFLDCTGDGLVGFLAGADYRIGREAKAEFGEDWAPDQPDAVTLGSTLLFYTKDTGRPVRYVAPSFAKDIAKTSIPVNRVIRSGDSGCHYWWIEFGGDRDAVTDNEAIRDELSSVIYGIWDYIKNSGKFDAETLTLEWVGSLPGKREYRRFIGDYTLTQNDILAQTPFEDGIAFGGWSIDLHPPGGMYAEESGSKHKFADGVYTIPYRSLYSRNVGNLLFAGRNISASHVAFGTTRVMATCALLGEAAGTAAALSVERGVSPRGLYRSHLSELRQTLLRQDASVIGYANADPADLARRAAVRSSGSLRRLALEKPSGGFFPLDADAAVLLPVDPRLDRLELRVQAAENTRLCVELWDTARPENYVPHERVAEAACELEAGEGWASLPLSWTPSGARNGFVIIRRNPAVRLCLAEDTQSGMLMFRSVKQPIENQFRLDDPIKRWPAVNRTLPCLRVFPDTAAFSAEKLLDGYVRPFGGPHLWISANPVAGQEAPWAALEWESPVAIKRVLLTFNDDVNEDLINLHHHETPFPVIPELVRGYRLEALVKGEWRELARVADNRRRRRVHVLDQPVQASALRLVVDETNGAPLAEVFEIRVYGE
ncbi:FAD-dependent oxidoreductase [Gorillibacterium sp. sgz500922]|uniref:FAD-dependent oxidoreductase n=1 Tax=Gorillibacterium sp. sgz500922 TaxID=3446694 RepID=UPI003F675BAA